MNECSDPQSADDGAMAPAVREPRTGRLFIAQLALESGAVVKIRIRNISSGGMGGISEPPLSQGQRGHVLLAGVGLVTGRVAWTRGPNFGMQFDARIEAEHARMTPAAIAPAPSSDFVVADRFRPVHDHKRPGFKR